MTRKDRPGLKVKESQVEVPDIIDVWQKTSGSSRHFTDGACSILNIWSQLRIPLLTSKIGGLIVVLNLPIGDRLLGIPIC